MRVLRVISSTNPVGGGPIEALRGLQAPLAALGVEVEVASCDDPHAAWLSSDSLPIHALGPSMGVFSYTPRLLRWLTENISRYDVGVIEGLWQYHGYAVWRATKRGATPYAIFPHGMLDPWFRHRYPLKHLKKTAYWLMTERRVLSDAGAVIFTCEQERLLARQSFPLYQGREVVSSLGTASPPTVSAQPLLRAHPELHGKRIILFLGRLHEKKGCDLLLDSFALVARRDERLHLVMAGPDQGGIAGRLRERATMLGVADRVAWPGMLQGEMKWAAFSGANVFCLPSHQENFGIAVVESLASGKPVLISDKVNIWPEIEQDGAGFVDDDTVEGTTRNLERWLALDANAYREMCVRARQSFESRFHIDHVAQRLASILSGCLQ